MPPSPSLRYPPGGRHNNRGKTQVARWDPAPCGTPPKPYWRHHSAEIARAPLSRGEPTKNIVRRGPISWLVSAYRGLWERRRHKMLAPAATAPFQTFKENAFSSVFLKRGHRRVREHFVAAALPKTSICVLQLEDRTSLNDILRGLASG